jgi:hypothetical protein
MKRSVRKPVMFAALLLFGAITFYSCDEDDLNMNPKLAVPSLDALPEGNMLSYMNGNVNLDILPGAVSNPVRISVNECHGGSNCDFVLKTISIEPLMSFNVPVNVSLKYDGELANSEEAIAGCNLIIYSWEKQDYFYSNGTCKTCCCYLDENNRTINFRITQTGIFAVGIKPSDLSEY